MTLAQPTVEPELRVDLPQPKALGDLSRIAFDALCFFPPLYVRSILGDPLSWIPPYPELSEFGILDPARPGEALRFLLRVNLPGWAVGPFPLVPSEWNPFWRPTRILHHPDRDGRSDAYPDEAWFYINGVATDETVARLNASLLVGMFERPLTIVQNSTNSLFVDLVECAVGKSTNVMTEPAVRAYPVILEALNDDARKRVVVICHSQGTIIMSNVLRALVDETSRSRLFDAGSGIEALNQQPPPEPLRRRDNLRKLEIYAFANCADVMRQIPVRPSGGGRVAVPWIENFGNAYDMVARLGMLAPAKRRSGIEIDGTSFVRESEWGHLLNQHYLLPMRKHLEAPREEPNPYVAGAAASRAPFPCTETPRLYGYFGGHTPPPY